MCILCVVQKWSRRVATMLPWLVIPLIGLWALSQLLPPGFRFEVTSPRLACVLVLLVTLFWYEVLMPQLSAWRLRRSARLRERKRFEAIEMQKLRKTATRRCRNCLTPYRDQNPGGGRFMCSYCGHISKRPVLDMPGAAGLGISNSGIIGDLVGKGGKIWNGKVWSENGWICTQDWLENGNWVSGSFSGKTSYLGKNRSAFSSGDDCCLAEKSYSGVLVFGSKLLSSSFLSIRWLCRKISGVSSAGEDTSSEVEHKGVLSKKGENGINFHESRGEKARRKAEEKRQARLEREILEEEERKQREEVARLVEERRRLRDEKIESEKEHGKGSDRDKGRDSKREAQRKRQEKRKEKDKGSSKSNSDVEELEKRAGREGERKGEFDKRIEIERRELQRNTLESVKAQGLETGHGTRSPFTNNFNRGNVGTRYLDRMKGTFLSSKAFSGGNFFGKGIQTSATAVSKANKSNGSIDNVQTSAYRREVHSADHVAGKLNSNGDDKITDTGFHHTVGSEPQRWTPPKKSWQQLFTRSSAVSPSPIVNVISRPSQKLQGEVQSPLLSSQGSPPHPLDNPIHFGLSLPFTLSPFPTGSISSGLVTSSAAEPTYSIRGSPQELLSEEPELFEDPCYVPDPVSLLGPVSESLDNFPVDLGSGFVTDVGLERPHLLKNLSASTEANKPSPIESPMSRLRVSEERHATCNLFNSKNQDLHASPMSDSGSSQQGTWQMWGTSPLGQDGLGLVGGSSSWFIPGGQSRSNQEDIVHPSACKAMIPQFVKENKDILSTCPPQKVGSANCQNGGMFSPLGPTSKDNDMWLEKNAFDPLLGDVENHFLPLNPQDIPRMKCLMVAQAGQQPSIHLICPQQIVGPKRIGVTMVRGKVLVLEPQLQRGLTLEVYFPPQMYSQFGHLIETRRGREHSVYSTCSKRQATSLLKRD